jgi:ribonucleoside-diphosphate reductase alpha chain
LEATNPCGEQWLGPYENCCLGSLNLAEHFGDNNSVDWEKLRQNTVLATRFLDNVVDANQYVPSVPQLREAALRARRIGLGIMGLADLMYHVGIRYGSPEGQEFSAQVIEFVRYHAMLTSIDLAKERGAFPAITGSIYDPENLTWQPPVSILPYTHDWARPALDWNAVVAGIRKHGIRNAAQTTIAPTGTIATVAGCEGYGCEPVFALAYMRHVNDNGKDLTLNYASPLFEQALVKAGIPPAERQRMVDQVMQAGSCQHISELPESVRNVFVVSMDISADEHVRTQAAMQAFVDNSLSKTINFSEGATPTDVASAYMLAWKLGCKGITVYVTGSRDKVVLETAATATKKAPAVLMAAAPEDETYLLEAKKARPRFLPGFTYSIETPLGKAFITINENGGHQPFEIFLNTAKAGSDTAAISESIGRMISYILRIASPIPPIERMKEVIRQMNGIGGGRPLGFGPNRVRSLPDGVARVLEEYVAERDERLSDNPPAEHNNGRHHHKEVSPAPGEMPLSIKIGDLCPECGQATFVNEEGCRKCYTCGYSEC